ncbi:adhesion G protein-coupled receptor E3-like [Mytilus californianus]|uniref:adhesion G protein-coupled receptor E3-like n=1 Tax=Mytilus californianus TaxID=6549 RepID=UPI002248325E|nr:adhesion G protein-coupled receptor E3-like [Mytilus californianus]
MMLSLHLLVAHSLYLFGFNATWNDKLCSSLGLLTHYFWLASIFWMHICTVHMFRVFFSMKMKPTVKQSKRVVVVYSFYASIIAGLLVASNITYYLASDQNKQTNGYLGYGGDKCYITLTEMILFTFAIPVGILLASNVVLFCLVIYKIENLPEVNSNKGRDRNMFVIYAKLTCLTGITWMFGFIYEWIHVPAFSYVFILLNASQGLFIFLSFCCNDRVRLLISYKWRGLYTHESGSSRNS